MRLHSRLFTGRVAINNFTTRPVRVPSKQDLLSIRLYSASSPDSSSSSLESRDEPSDSVVKPAKEVKAKPKTQAELDKELLAKLQGLDGDGGAAGVEYEDGKPVSMKRSVKNNMFRYI